MMLQDYYKWQVVLDDGKVFDQSKAEDKEKFKFNNKNKNFEKIKTFILIPQERNLNKIVLNIPKDSRLIYFRRTIANTGNLFPKFHINMIGWQTTINKSNFKSVMYIFPDGTSEISCDDEPVYTETFINSLPMRDSSEIKSCTGCTPRLERAK